MLNKLQIAINFIKPKDIFIKNLFIFFIHEFTETFLQ